jgi:hypothetical protein
MNENVHDYSDIYNMKPPTSPKHPRMSMKDRAAQFSPFAALTGYGSSITEAGRTTAEKRILSSEEKLRINEEIHYLIDHPKCMFSITYFIKDETKPGGNYQKETLQLKKYLEEEKALLLTDNRKIHLDDIYSMECLDDTQMDE